MQLILDKYVVSHTLNFTIVILRHMKNFIFILLIISNIGLFYAQDWSNLKRFQKENAELNDPQSSENRVVFMGNSITEFWSKMRPSFFIDKSYINRGISGQTTPQMLLRFRQDVIHLNPSVVVILAGINDIAGNTGLTKIEVIANNIISMIELAKSNNIKVVLCSVLPVFDFPWKQGLKPAEKVIKLNSLLKSYAEKNSIVYVDYFSPMVNEVNGLKKKLGDDGVHPNITGYIIMEPLLENAIVKALAQK
jgi:lysophospholipase L1-like esterase